MKKRSLLALGLAVALCFSGCGISDTDGDSQEDNITDTAVSGDSADDEANEATEVSGNENSESIDQADETGEDSQEDACLLPIMATSIEEYDSYDYNDSNLAYISGSFPYIISDGYDNLKAALKEKSTAVWEDQHYALDMAKEETTYEDFSEDDETLETLGFPWYSVMSMECSRADSVVFSYVTNTSGFLGGAHPDYYASAYTFDSQTGEELLLSDVLCDYDGFYDAVIEKLETECDTENFFEEWKDNVHDIFYDIETYSGPVWYMDRNGINIVFNIYDIQPYAYGNVELYMSFEEYGDLVEADYQPKDTASFFYRLGYNDMDENGVYEYSLDVNGDGEDEILAVENNLHWDNDFGYYDYTQVRAYFEDAATDNDEINSQPIRTDEGDFKACKVDMLDFAGAYIMTSPDGKYYLYIEASNENDYHDLYIFDISDPEDGPKDCGENESGAFYDMLQSDPSHLLLEERLYIMGTYTGYRECYISDDGQLIPYDEEYTVITRDYDAAIDTTSDDDYGMGFELTVKKNLKNATLYEDINDRESGVDYTIPKGTSLTPAYTDDSSYMIFRVNDGSGNYVKISYDEDGYNMINGKDENKYLDGILYAG